MAVAVVFAMPFWVGLCLLWGLVVGLVGRTKAAARGGPCSENRPYVALRAFSGPWLMGASPAGPFLAFRLRAFLDPISFDLVDEQAHRLSASSPFGALRGSSALELALSASAAPARLCRAFVRAV